jgi:transposase
MIDRSLRGAPGVSRIRGDLAPTYRNDKAKTWVEPLAKESEHHNTFAQGTEGARQNILVPAQPHSRELTPIECIWLYLRERFLWPAGQYHREQPRSRGNAPVP